MTETSAPAAAHAAPGATTLVTADDSPSRRSILLLFAGLMVAMLLASLDQTIFSTALPTIVGELDGVDHMYWVTTAYILASTIAMPAYGKLGDLVGRKWLFVTAIGLFLVGSVIGGLADSMTMLIAGRAVQGLGGGGLMILAQAIIADVVPARQRGRYMGVMGAVFAVSSVAGPLLGGFFTDGPGWRWAFWMNVPLGILAIIAAVAFLRMPDRGAAGRPRLDVAGMTVLAIAATCLVLATTWGGTQYDWLSPQIIGLGIGTVLAAIAFVAIERRAAEPIIPLDLFRNRDFNLTTAAGLLTGVAMFGVIAYMPTYLQMVTGVGATQAGLLMIPMMAGLLVSSIGSGRFVSRTGIYRPLPVAGAVLAALALSLMSTFAADAPVWLIGVYLAIMGVGLGLNMQLLVLVVQNSFPITRVGTATAANSFFRQIGSSMGAAVVGSVFSARLADLLTERLSGAGAPAGSDSGSINSLTPERVAELPGPIRDVVVGSYNEALTPIFLWLVPLMAVAGILLLFLSGKPLATRIERGGQPGAGGRDGDPTAERTGDADAAAVAAPGAPSGGMVAATTGAIPVVSDAPASPGAPGERSGGDMPGR